MPRDKSRKDNGLQNDKMGLTYFIISYMFYK